MRLPSRCSPVPAATGKLIICAAKMNTAVRPGRRSPIVEFGTERTTATPSTAGEDEREQAHRRVDELSGNTSREVKRPSAYVLDELFAKGSGFAGLLHDCRPAATT